MSAKLLGMVLEADLPRARKYVLLALADHAKEDGSDVYPSVARIEWMTGYGERQVRTLMDELERDGILVLVRQGGYGPQDTNEYRIEAGKLKALRPFREWAKSRKRKGAKTATISLQTLQASRVQNLQQKGAISDEIRVQFSQNKGAKTADELKNKNQELEPLREKTEKPPASVRPSGLSQTERDSWDLRRWREAKERLTPPPGARFWFMQPEAKEEAELEMDRAAAYDAGITIERLQELLRPFFANHTYVDRLKVEKPISAKETA